MFFRQLPLFILAIASPAVAQRTTSNVVTASDDAFGRAVGNDKIGIYSIESVRVSIQSKREMSEVKVFTSISNPRHRPGW
ncbi:MAG: hypothetical protein IPN48_12135 [Sphingomonadales bacterium]|nr:hypothetical protein [Sphingomonadales bacterium]